MTQKQVRTGQNPGKKSTLKEIAEQINQAKKIFIFSHHSPDGDGLGASTALQLAFQKTGKESYVIMEDEVPDFLKFMMTDAYRYDDRDVKAPDLCLAVDCADEKRFLKRRKIFFSAPLTVNIDHHYGNSCFADMNYVDGDRAAACEIVFDLLGQMEVPIDKEMAAALYTGIVTDTGRFQYSNTSARTHHVVAQLFDAGIDVTDISEKLFQSDSLSRKKLIAKMFETTELYQEGAISVACITLQMLKETGANIGDTEGAIDQIRDIKGVEVAVLLKEIGEKTTRVSLRSKSRVDVNEIAVKFGGGGHKRASGCILNCPVADAKKFLIEELQGLNWNEWNNQFE